jgi:hypothetical protein
VVIFLEDPAVREAPKQRVRRVGRSSSCDMSDGEAARLYRRMQAQILIESNRC